MNSMMLIFTVSEASSFFAVPKFSAIFYSFIFIYFLYNIIWLDVTGDKCVARESWNWKIPLRQIQSKCRYVQSRIVCTCLESTLDTWVTWIANCIIWTCYQSISLIQAIYLCYGILYPSNPILFINVSRILSKTNFYLFM